MNLGSTWAKKWLDRVKAKTVSISKANVAAQIMEHLCTCPLHGYSQLGRHGTSGHCSVQTDAGTIEVTRGSRLLAYRL